MKVLITGDLHGNGHEAVRVVNHAVSHSAQIILQCGDFGFWSGYDGIEYLDRLNYALRKNNRTLIFADGNHEDHDALERCDNHNPRSKTGQVYIRSHILHSPRGNYWKWGDKYFMTVGGAVSIDKAMRTPGKNWWEGEELTDAQADGIVANMIDRRKNGRPDIDYLITHDCSNRTPFGRRLKPDLDSQIHRQRLDRVLEAVRPRIHFHGHMHERYDWMNRISDGWVQTYGLECDGMRDNWGILDTETDEFLFRGESLF